ncbi:concanavalin A-like lectin/glucanase domain-containing protein [Lactarius quietus]|nr:concanavalin A-like lectin/glucanase domain-containing protein [Lactarius quietus]
MRSAASGYAILATLLSLTLCARADFYLKDEWIGDGFFQGWNWETIDDPTHGRVNYVDQSDAKMKNLTYADGEKFVMRADDVSFVPSSARGRDSIRISTLDAYRDAVFVLDLAHMPTGCGTWPAFWTLSKTGPWPNGGEIDIIEGVNEDIRNQATLHTSPNCKMPTERHPQTGRTLNTDCDAAVKFNEGCGVRFSDPHRPYTSYGAPFNVGGGGYYAMYKGRDAVKIWFFPRWSKNIPAAIQYGVPRGYSVKPDDPSWGEPDANFPFDDTLCHEEHFDAHKIVFDLTFCGDWAGTAWSNSECAERSNSCVDFVNNNPSEFREAYWEINSLRVYTPEQPR